MVASAAMLPIGAPPAVADSMSPYPCDSEWLPTHERGLCDADPTTGRVPPAAPVPPGAPQSPVGPRAPVPSRPGSPH